MIRRDNKHECVYYDTYINGHRFRFSDEEEALQIAHRYGSNLFRCVDTLHWKPEDEPSGASIRLVAKTLNGNIKAMVDGDYFDIEHAFHNALQDKCTRQITIYISHH